MRVSLLSALSFGFAAQAVTVTYDPGYDIAARSLDAVACSNGENGLETKYGWKVQSDVPSFPYIGGSFRVGGWNSPSCGNCYSITFDGVTVNVTAVDYAARGFNIGKKAMNKLTGGRAEELGRVEATSRRVALKYCGL